MENYKNTWEWGENYSTEFWSRTMQFVQLNDLKIYLNSNSNSYTQMASIVLCLFLDHNRVLILCIVSEMKIVFLKMGVGRMKLAWWSGYAGLNWDKRRELLLLKSFNWKSSTLHIICMQCMWWWMQFAFNVFPMFYYIYLFDVIIWCSTLAVHHNVFTHSFTHSFIIMIQSTKIQK